ncbi:MAG TPA: hypothetical protein VFP22_07555, partial [Candidatus Limnocylindrales bacterium]|nr:hypothetical protein [Candidatus Limnocylindrales bacterium]
MKNRPVLALAASLVLAACVLAGNAAGSSALHVTATAQFPAWSTYPMRFDPVNDALWFVEIDDANVVSLVKLNPATLAVEHSTTADVQGAAFYDLAIGLGHEWVVNWVADYSDPSAIGSISEYDAAGNFVKTISSYGHGPNGVAFLDGKLWVANHHQDAPGTSGSVVEIDPSTGNLLARVRVGAQIRCCGPTELAAADGAIWVGVPNLNGIVRIDPTTLATSLIPGGNGGGQDPLGACGGFAGDPATHRLWLTDAFCRPSSILQLDTSSGTVTGSINPGGVAAGLA